MPIIVDKEKKKKQILTGALSAFSEKGFYSTTMSDIAEKTGIGKGTIYEYFEDKEALFMTLLDHVLDEFFEEFTHIPQEGDPVKQLQKVFLEGIKIYEKEERLLRFFIFYWGVSFGSDQEHLINKRLRKSFSRNREYIEQTYLRGVKEGAFKKMNPTHVSASLMALAEFVPMQWVVDKQSFPLKETGKAAFNIFIQGILKKH